MDLCHNISYKNIYILQSRGFKGIYSMFRVKSVTSFRFNQRSSSSDPRKRQITDKTSFPFLQQIQPLSFKVHIKLNTVSSVIRVEVQQGQTAKAEQE